MGRPGLQPERTSLAWNRTALAGLALLGAVGKVAADNADALTLTCTAIVLAHTFIVAACAVARGRAVTPEPTRRLFVVTYVSTVVASLAAVTSVGTSW